MIVRGICNYLDDKRPYLPGITVQSKCPTCKREIMRDMSIHYPWGIKEDGTCFISFYCPDCDDNWEEKAMLTVSLAALS